MRQRTINFINVGISTAALLISGIALYLTWDTHENEYDKIVVLQPGGLPAAQLKKGHNTLALEVINTSKKNLQYYLRASTNMGCISGTVARPLHYPCVYQSQMVGLSRSDASKNTHKHLLELDAQPGAVDTHPLAVISPAGYYLTIEIIEAGNERLLYKSRCFYGYHVNAKVFALDQPVVDTTGQSDRMQVECRP